MAGEKNTPPGPATDSSGQSTIDPSENVKALNEASVRRLDDMADASSKSMRREIVALRREMKLRAHYEEKLRTKESERLDAIRTVDVNAVAAAAGVQRSAAETLAKQVADTAEAARQAMAAAAVANATSLRAEIAPLQKDIADLRQSQYEGVGAKETTRERGVSMGVWVGLGIAAVFGLLSFLVSLGGLVIALNR